jgi:hypothetical protein
MSFRVGVKNNTVAITKVNTKKAETKKAEKIHKEK